MVYKKVNRTAMIADIARWDYFDNENARFFIFFKSISAESPPFS